MKIKFDRIDADGGDGTFIASGYAGMDWSNFAALNVSDRDFFPSGFLNGLISGVSVGYNGNSDPASFTTESTDFALKKGWFTGAWNNGLTVTVDAWDDGVHVAHKVFTVDYGGPTKIRFDNSFASVDSVTIDSSGGADADPDDIGSGEHVAIENLVVEFEAPAASDRHDHAHHHGHHWSASGHADGHGMSDWLLS